ALVRSVVAVTDGDWQAQREAARGPFFRLGCCHQASQSSASMTSWARLVNTLLRIPPSKSGFVSGLADCDWFGKLVKAHGFRPRQLRFVYLQPGPLPGVAGRGGGCAAELRGKGG